jgi:predicted acetyltransferase
MSIVRETPGKDGLKIEVVVDGEPVSSLVLSDRRMRIGHVAVRCGGIGAVETKPEHRLKGYASRAMERAVEVMRREGFHLSALFGIADFYHRFGYVSCLVECESTVTARDAQDAEARFDVRDMEPGDMPIIAGICEARKVLRTGSMVRDPTTWTGFRWSPHWHMQVKAFVAVDGDRIVGYVAYDPETKQLIVGEVGYTTPAVFSTLLAHMARLAVERQAEQIHLFMPPDDPFLEYCHRYGCKTELTYSRDAEGLGRIIDQEGLLRMLRPHFERQLAAGGMAHWQGALVVRTELGEHQVQFGRGGPSTTLAVPQWMLAQLLLGYRSIADVLLEAAAQTSTEMLAVLTLLFPPGYPYVWAADRF